MPTRKSVKSVIVPMMYGSSEGGDDGKGGAYERCAKGDKPTKAEKDFVDAVYDAAEDLAPDAFRLMRTFKKVANAFSNRGEVKETRKVTRRERVKIMKKEIRFRKDGSTKEVLVFAGYKKRRRMGTRLVNGVPTRGRITTYVWRDVVKEEETGYGSSNPIQWRTPSGFRCLLDTRIPEKDELRYTPPAEHPGRVPKERCAVIQMPTETIACKEQRSSLAAHVIHSLDASVLVASVNLGTSRGIRSWGLAHDSYAVHPNQGETRFDVLRQAARETFKGDYLAELWEQLRQQLAGAPPVPGKPLPAMPPHPAELPAGFGEGRGMYR